MFQPDIDSGGENLFHRAFKNEMAFLVGFTLVKQDAGFVDEVFVSKKPNQSVGLVASPGNRHILGGCREEKQGKKKCSNPSFHAVKTRKSRVYCFSGNFTSIGKNLEVSPPFL